MLEKIKRDGDGNEIERSTTTYRLQVIVYFSLTAFAILAAYGFFLIHSLAENVGSMAKDIGKMTTHVSDNMDHLSVTIEAMSGKMSDLVENTKEMSTTMHSLDKHTDMMSSSVSSMNNNTHSMANTTQDMASATNSMQQDLWSLNQNISTPLSLFNQFIPWSNNNQGRFPGSQTPFSYYPYYSPPSTYIPNNAISSGHVDSGIAPPTSPSITGQ